MPATPRGIYFANPKYGVFAAAIRPNNSDFTAENKVPMQGYALIQPTTRARNLWLRAKAN